MTKRKNGQGTIAFESARNKYRAVFTSPTGKRIQQRFDTEQEAERWLVINRAEIETGDFLQPSAESFGAYALYYLKEISKHNVRIRTFERYKSLANHLLPLFHFPLQDLRNSDFISLYNKIELSGTTKLKIHRLASQILKQALLDRKIKYNPLEGIKAPKPEKPEIETFTQDELRQIFAMADNYRYKELFILMSVTGMRSSEAIALRYKDFHTTTNQIHINQTLHQSASSGIIFEKTKNKTSNRKISIPEEVVKLLQSMEKSHPELLFSTSNSTPLDALLIGKVWRRLLKSADIPYRSLKSLRHTHATELLRAGVPITEVSRRLGHAKVSTTLDVYSHSLPADDSRVIDIIPQIYNIIGHNAGHNTPAKMTKTHPQKTTQKTDKALINKDFAKSRRDS